MKKEKNIIKDPIILDKNIPCVLVGDTHGNNFSITNFLNTNNIKANFIQVGDFGIGFYGWEDKLVNLNYVLNKHDSYLYVIRGNHDNPFYFKTEYSLSNVLFLDDYRLLQIGDEYILIIGGAYSLDRTQRINDDRNYLKYHPGGLYVSYWKDEVFDYKPELIDELCSKYNIKYIVTHSAPIEWYPIGIESTFVNSWAKYDHNIKRDLTQERTDLSKMYNQIISKIQIKEWIYGHFHASYASTYDNTKVVLLNCDELYELRINTNI